MRAAPFSSIFAWTAVGLYQWAQGLLKGIGTRMEEGMI